MAEGTGFLGRWSRRKLDVKEGKAIEEEPQPAAPVAAMPVSTADEPPALSSQSGAHLDDSPSEPPLPTLQDALALTPQSDFKPFMAQGVAPEVKNAAMKKLFADPQFNVMDGLDVYIDDYSKPDPLPASMLRQMASAKFLKLFDDEEEEGQKEAMAKKPLGPRDDADTPPAPAVAQSDLCTSLPSKPESPALAASQTHDAHTDLRLQPDDAAAAREPGQGAE